MTRLRGGLTRVLSRVRPARRRSAQSPAPERPTPATPTPASTAPAVRAATPGRGGQRSPARAAVRPGPPPGRHLAYAPQLDGDADPGEIVWTWVAYEDDPNRGKDRPVLVVGRDQQTLYGLMLSSQDHHDGERGWLALGAGDWDAERRPSWLRLDRVLEVDEDGIRREGAVLDVARFRRVADILRRSYGWH